MKLSFGTLFVDCWVRSAKLLHPVTASIRSQTKMHCEQSSFTWGAARGWVMKLQQLDRSPRQARVNFIAFLPRLETSAAPNSCAAITLTHDYARNTAKSPFLSVATPTELTLCDTRPTF